MDYFDVCYVPYPDDGEIKFSEFGQYEPTFTFTEKGFTIAFPWKFFKGGIREDVMHLLRTRGFHPLYI